tara:strand:- start:363 stop:497 length:135 start_codon:yes stop_codon:yes gene_type:complete
VVAMDKIPMTVKGEKLLRDELSELKTIIRPKYLKLSKKQEKKVI